MIEITLTPEELSNLLPSVLRPVEGLRAALSDATYPFAIRRLSAFSRFATTQSELMELLDDAPEKESGYREAFLSLVKNIATETPCLRNQRRYKPRDAVYTRLDLTSITHDLVRGLTEEDAIDIVLPEKKIALIGHDDFGCNVLVSHDNESAFPWVERHAKQVGLYLLDLPAAA